ncbi:fasciclin domain-containing protein [Nocardioides iriomotensis]|uniref:Fasciclin domain-containing protein n=1 Tax=Nocardioides iriomotensis TaxID=715784 RepID=A0A4Q5IU96_9ACTN|nr:fasciclin domain-containing protein [Nocardioides iriomotensis]RYU09430.1 fasciclin domain-containing protein [Nocardioides iriomotensis]
MRTMKKVAASIAVVSAITMTAACGGNDSAADTTDESSATPMQSETPSDSMEEDDMASDPAANLVGPGCADYAEQVPDGAGSVEGMSADPVAVAASNNPLLKTLTAAVSGQLNPKVDLVDTLNGDEFTVFAPVDDAFAQLPKKTVKALGTPKGAETLSTVLTYHVVPGQLSPDEIAGTTQTTVQGGDVEITGSGDSLKVNDANVICGGVQTANATVYLIDSVLMPQM